jgi:1,4-dihydroxy-2-naphthoate octaprenyltransferase
MNIKAWLSAFRFRTLPLAFSSILMGSFLAYSKGEFKTEICVWALFTTLFLQILSNLANDYGDSQNGADNALRTGPQRAVQSGIISPNQMLLAVIIFSVLSFISGISLLYIAFDGLSPIFGLFVLIGLGAIAAAVKYTSGKNPYGYVGLGDVSVFIFFGLVGVCGTYYLHTQIFNWSIILPAISCGLFAVAVLNLNNMRDIMPDTFAGKLTIPVRIGLEKAKIYHISLILIGFLAALVFHIFFVGYSKIMFFLLVLVFWSKDLKFIMKADATDNLEPFLKKTALGTLAFVLLFGIGMIL